MLNRERIKIYTSQFMQILISTLWPKLRFEVKSYSQGNAISVSLESVSKMCYLEFAMRFANKIMECRLCLYVCVYVCVWMYV